MRRDLDRLGDILEAMEAIEDTLMAARKLMTETSCSGSGASGIWR